MDATLICITNDGVHIFAEPLENAGFNLWGESDREGRVEIRELKITRRMDKKLPKGEHPADLVSYLRA